MEGPELSQLHEQLNRTLAALESQVAEVKAARDLVTKRIEGQHNRDRAPQWWSILGAPCDHRSTCLCYDGNEPRPLPCRSINLEETDDIVPLSIFLDKILAVYRKIFAEENPEIQKISMKPAELQKVLKRLDEILMDGDILDFDHSKKYSYYVFKSYAGQRWVSRMRYGYLAEHALHILRRLGVETWHKAQYYWSSDIAGIKIGNRFYDFLDRFQIDEEKLFRLSKFY
jgi:hypothetical protein